VDTSIMYFHDIEACCRNDDVKGAILVEGGAADSVIEAIRTVKDVDNIETITIKDANLDTHVESWVRSVLLVEGMLGDLVIRKNSFTEWKWHLEYKCDDEEVGLTVATLSLRESECSSSSGMLMMIWRLRSRVTTSPRIINGT